MGIDKIAVLGSGQMGSGIAEAVAVCGMPVTLVKATPGPSDSARARIEKSLGRLVEKGKMEQGDADAALRLISYTDDLSQVADSDLLIESIVEDAETKKARFAEADTVLKAGAILASNTSTLGITDMSAAARRREHFIGLHFFNPATVMKLVEVIPTESTEAKVTAVAVSFVESIGKTPVLAKDSTGFIVNRLLTPYMCDAVRALELGLADIADIDTAMELGANHPLGPLALADYIGLDIVCAMAENLNASFGNTYMPPPPLLKELVKTGKLGRKTKLGFYDYSEQPKVPNKSLSA